jgi:hypothetical protein
MIQVYIPAFCLGVREELEKVAELQTKVPGETPEQLLSRVRSGKADFPKFLENAQQHTWNIPGFPLGGNAIVHNFINSNIDKPSVIKDKILKQDDNLLLNIIKKNPDAFKGVQNSQPMQPLTSKLAFDVSSMPVNENILPSLASQAKWKYVRTKDGLKLSDGNLVYSFGGFPESYPSEDAMISRLADDNILDFEKDHVSKGTAQIHRSSPDNIYMTLADGSQNPTFMLQHETGQNWRYSPSKKFLQKLKALEQPKEDQNVTVDPASLLAGASDIVKEASLAAHDLIQMGVNSAYPKGSLAEQAAMNPYHPRGFFDASSLAAKIKSTGNSIGDAASRTVGFAADHPLASILGTYALAKGIGKARDFIDPSREEERKNESQTKKVLREFADVSTAALPTLASMAYMRE